MAQLVVKGNELVLRLWDNGKGFQPLGERDGLGLSNLSQRAHSLGAELTISSQEGCGTEVHLRVPLR